MMTLSILMILSVVNIAIMVATFRSLSVKIKTVEEALETHSEVSEYYLHKINKASSAALVELRWESTLRQEELDYGSDSDTVDEDADVLSGIEMMELLVGGKGLEISDEYNTEGNVIYLTYQCKE